MTNKKKPACSLVIRCFNEENHINRLLAGVMNQTVRDVEIVIVDSGSTDATLSIASRYPVKVINITPANFSFGRALNVGCSNTSGEFIVIASAHVYPLYKDWIERLLVPLKDPRVSLAYGKQRGNETTQFSESQIFTKWFPDQIPDNKPAHPFCNNANAAIRRSSWELMPYDETLTGLEDIEWAKRTIEAGFNIVYVPEATVIHIHEETPNRILNRHRREAIALKHIFPYEKFSFIDFIRLFVKNVFSDFYHAVQRKVLCKNFKDILVFRFMQFLGTYRGFVHYDTMDSNLKYTFYYPNGWTKREPEELETDSDRKIDYNVMNR